MSFPTHFECACGELFLCDEAFTAFVQDEGILRLCPRCGSEDLEDAWLCERCGIRRADEEGTDLCHVCFAEEDKADAMWDQAKEGHWADSSP